MVKFVLFMLSEASTDNVFNIFATQLSLILFDILTMYLKFCVTDTSCPIAKLYNNDRKIIANILLFIVNQRYSSNQREFSKKTQK